MPTATSQTDSFVIYRCRFEDRSFPYGFVPGRVVGPVSSGFPFNPNPFEERALTDFTFKPLGQWETLEVKFLNRWGATPHIEDGSNVVVVYPLFELRRHSTMGGWTPIKEFRDHSGNFPDFRNRVIKPTLIAKVRDNRVVALTFGDSEVDVDIDRHNANSLRSDIYKRAWEF